MKTQNKPNLFWIVLPVIFLGVFTLWTSILSPAQAGVVAAPNVDPDIALVPFASGLSAPVDIANAGDSRLFIVEQAGTIRIAQNNGTVLGTPFLNIAAKVLSTGEPGASGNEQGLLGLVFDPNYVENGYFYINYTRDTSSSANDGDTVIARYHVSADPNVADAGSETILMVVDQPYSNHNGGDLNFGPDGYLYIGLGDGGSGGDPGNRAQTGSELLGKMLRIDVDGGGNAPDCGSGPYTIPADNPFIGAANTCDEIWQFGVRNPWRFSFDSETGDMYIGDVGQNAWEEVNYQPASSTGGENWGWRCYEGTHVYNTSGCLPASNYDFPFFDYTHSGGSCSVTGGYVYRGSQYPVFYGHYIFADYCSGLTWTASNNGGWNVISQGDLGGSFTSFGVDLNGEIYLASSNGIIYHVTDTATPPTPTPTSLPPTPTPTPTQPINLEPVTSGFIEPVDVENAGDERLFVAERAGVVYEVSGEGAVIPEPLLVITDRVGTEFFQQGFLSLAFHPDLINHPYLYTQYTATNGNVVVSRFAVSGTITSTTPLQPIDPATEFILLDISHPASDENNGGELAFGPDGYLYISVGDGGTNANGQNLDTLLGKVLRLDVDNPPARGPSGVLPYAIPSDNPFVDDPNARDEIWSFGLRNVWRYSFDALTGDLYLGDVGDSNREEIDFQPASSAGGENYGWSCYEGTVQGPGFSGACTDTYVDPIHEYNHATGITVVGGYVYRGCQYTDMAGKYYFADYGFGNLWSLEADGGGGYLLDELLSFSGQQYSSFGQGVDGELYLLDYSGGTLYHLAGNQFGDCFFTDTLWLPLIYK